MSKKKTKNSNSQGKPIVHLNSIANATLSIHGIYNFNLDPVSVFETLLEQNKSLVDDNRTRGLETMLAMQAKVLDALFHRMIERAMNTEYIESLQVHMGIALKAQKQARQTLSTLADLKSPRHTAFVKQQNIAVNQQVNNIEQESKNLENSANELLREATCETLDPRGTPEAISAD